MSTSHDLMGGKLHVYRRENSPFWQCATYLNGRNHRTSTKLDSLAHAKDFAEDWYLGLKGKLRSGEITGGETFAKAADHWLGEIEVLMDGERAPGFAGEYRRRLKLHILPFMGKRSVLEITPGLVQEYRVHRAATGVDHRTGQARRPTRSTLHKEIVCIRQVLKSANRRGTLPYLPNLAAPFRASGKVSHRAWFSKEEYVRLYEATAKRAAKPLKARWRWASEQLHDYVLLMGNTGLRPDEAGRLEFRDVQVVHDDATGKKILLIEVRGKRGVGYCKSMPGAVFPFERLKNRLRPKPVEGDEGAGVGRRAVAKTAQGLVKPEPTDKLFPQTHRELFNEILDELKLKHDRDGQARTAYSLRHAYICMRLSEGADIYQIAKNCRTSVEMIEKYYASHLANTLDAAAINVRQAKRRPARPEPPRKRQKSKQPTEKA
jgi:integrase